MVLYGAGPRGNDNGPQLNYGADLFLKSKSGKDILPLFFFQCPEAGSVASKLAKVKHLHLSAKKGNVQRPLFSQIDHLTRRLLEITI